MKLILALLFVALLFSSLVLADNWEKPWFCHEYDCPMFDVVKKTDDYSIRKYKSGLWVSVEGTGRTLITANSKAFLKLYNYISGSNEESKKIDMTTPVLVEYYGSRNDKETITMSFYLPYEYQSSMKPPTPKKDSGIRIVESPEVTVAVFEFGGHVLSYHDVESRLNTLKDSLHDDGVEFEEELRTVAIYDDPFKFRDRHNEVLVKVH